MTLHVRFKDPSGEGIFFHLCRNSISFEYNANDPSVTFTADGEPLKEISRYLRSFKPYFNVTAIEK